jgi:hypothetical protein
LNVKLPWVINPRWVLLAIALAGLLGMTGCATTGDEPENMSERPWNAPKGWENSLPGGMMEGR